MYFCGTGCNVSFFISLLIYFHLLSFVLVSPDKGLSILSFKKKLLVSLILLYCFSISILLISALTFVISFLLLTLGLVCFSFYGCLRYKGVVVFFFFNFRSLPSLGKFSAINCFSKFSAPFFCSSLDHCSAIIGFLGIVL